MNNIDAMKEKTWKIVPFLVIVLSIFLVIQTLNALKENRYIGNAGTSQNIISVSGEGEVFTVPDVATFTFSVTKTSESVESAQEEMTKVMNQAIDKVKSFGIEEKDIKTIDYSVYPKYEYHPEIVCIRYPCTPSNPTQVGYDVSQTVSVKVRKVDDAGEVLGSLGSLEVTNVSGLSFTIDEEDELVREARKQAIEDAQKKAEELARDLGVRLVRIVSFSESGYPMPMYYKAGDMAMGLGSAEAMSSTPPSLPTGENKITSNVNITYEIR